MLPLLPSDLSDNTLIQQARNLARQWQFEYTTVTSEPFYLLLSPEHLQLISSEKGSGPIFTDFSSGAIAHRRKFGGGKGQTIAKAIGFHKLNSPLVLDATAGMGKDAFVFATLGARVILMERSPVSAALLNDALQRAVHNPEIHDIIQRMSFQFGDARKLSPEDTRDWPGKPDVVYLDPMFPHRKKTALVKKEMLAFQTIIGSDPDSDQLLEAGLKLAKKRVVVKRPVKAPFLNKQEPTYSMKMKKHRFDIYII